MCVNYWIVVSIALLVCKECLVNILENVVRKDKPFTYLERY